jgi:hypothetical protein
MDKMYDVWVDYGYEGWHVTEVSIHDLDDYLKMCGQPYMVYETDSLILSLDSPT